MKKAILIIVVILIVVAAVYFAGMAAKKKRDEADRLIFDGKTRKEFVEYIKPLWRDKFTESSFSSQIKNQQYWNQTKELSCGEFDTYDDAGASDKIIACVEAKIMNNIVTDYDKYPDKYKPMSVEWARDYWIPKLMSDMNIEITDSTVQKVLKKF